MTERNEFVGAYGRLNRRNRGDGQNVPLGQGLVAQRRHGSRKAKNPPLGQRDPALIGLCSNIDHPGASRGVEMRKMQVVRYRVHGRRISGLLPPIEQETFDGNPRFFGRLPSAPAEDQSVPAP